MSPVSLSYVGATDDDSKTSQRLKFDCGRWRQAMVATQKWIDDRSRNKEPAHGVMVLIVALSAKSNKNNGVCRGIAGGRRL